MLSVSVGWDAAPLGRVEVGLDLRLLAQPQLAAEHILSRPQLRSHPEPPLHIVYASHHLAFQLANNSSSTAESPEPSGTAGHNNHALSASGSENFHARRLGIMVCQPTRARVCVCPRASVCFGVLSRNSLCVKHVSGSHTISCLGST